MTDSDVHFMIHVVIQVHVVLKLWKTGFSLDDGELRNYSDPGNALFLESIRRGYVQDVGRLFWSNYRFFWGGFFFCFVFIYKLEVCSYSCLLTPCKLDLCLREIPLELRQRARGGQVNLDMEDHRDEEFAKPKPAFKAFTGEGQKLGR